MIAVQSFEDLAIPNPSEIKSAYTSAECGLKYTYWGEKLIFVLKDRKKWYKKFMVYY